MTELALDTDLTTEQREYLTMVRSSAESLLSIINDILDFSKVEAGMMDLDPVEFRLRENIEETAKMLGIRAHQKGLELVCDIDPSVPDALVGDALRIRQVLVNLVGNAIKFTEKGEVVISVQHENETSAVAGNSPPVLRFAVRDTGIGVPASKVPEIFRAFSQADGSTTRKYGGTGLGLTISKRLVEMMGGRIWLESEVGQGATFYFTVPAAKAGETPRTECLEKVAHIAGIPVLVVDDNATNRRLLTDRLAEWGMVPTTVESAAAALGALAFSRRPFHLMITDVHMPETDGFDLVSEIRGEPRFANMAIIMLTSGSMPGDIARCHDLGVDAYLTKPVRQVELLKAIVKRVSARHISSGQDVLALKAAVAGERAEEPREAPAPLSRPAVLADRLHILLVEDNHINQVLATRLLGKQGHTAKVAGTGREALALFTQEDFDLVLMDVQMPDMGGLEATAAIRAQENVSGDHVPIVAMTARAISGDREKCLAAGMDDYVSKPIQIAELNAAIQRVMLTARRRPRQTAHG
jgi:CheY-like chemotaxis protein